MLRAGCWVLVAVGLEIFIFLKTRFIFHQMVARFLKQCCILKILIFLSPQNPKRNGEKWLMNFQLSSQFGKWVFLFL